MRKRFEQQLSIGQIPIEEVKIPTKNATSLDELLAALKEIYSNKEYSEKIFNVLEKYILANKKNTGREGMNLWTLFVLSQVRLCINADYATLWNMSNNHRTMRMIMGIEREFGFERIEFEYQNIYDNVNLLTDELVKELNDIILSFGHKEVFKKKEAEPLRLKTDSFVVESNVHFPTDYNLLWDSARKILDTIEKILLQHPTLQGWRKLPNWRYELKGLMRNLGRASKSGGKGKEERLKSAATKYLTKAKALLKKIQEQMPDFPQQAKDDIWLILSLEHFMILMDKHIDLVERRILKQEKIPHAEKMFSIFETFTEWITKGKSRPAVELGKRLSITTDQYNLIVDYYVMENEQDREIVLELADRMLAKYHIYSWSFDKGFWNKDNKQLLQLYVPQVIMPKLGRRNKAEEEEERAPIFKKLKNKHSAIESNINELEKRGLDRCPDKGFAHFKRYIGLGISAYNLKKIGRKILETKRQQLEKKKKKLQKVA